MDEATYAVYRGDEFVDVGTLEELSGRLGVKVETLRWYTYPSARERNRGGAITVERVEP